MEKTDKRYQAYIDILREELIPAMGCTELSPWPMPPLLPAIRWASCRTKVLVEASGSMDQKRQVGHRAQHG